MPCFQMRRNALSTTASDMLELMGSTAQKISSGGVQILAVSGGIYSKCFRVGGEADEVLWDQGEGADLQYDLYITFEEAALESVKILTSQGQKDVQTVLEQEPNREQVQSAVQHVAAQDKSALRALDWVCSL